MQGNGVTVGVDVGTTSVKAVAVDADGQIISRSRIPHSIVTTQAGRLEHDARRAWRDGTKKAYRAVTENLNFPIAGVTTASMIPSMTAVNKRGIPILPGVLYGDERGQPRHEDSESQGAQDLSFNGEWFLRWAKTEAPDAYGYWPCQAVATHALAGVPAMDSAASSSLGTLLGRDGWNQPLLDDIGVSDAALPKIVPMCAPGGTLPGSDTVFGGGTIDALADQIVSGATQPGDVLAIFGATVVIWIVTDAYVEHPPEGLFSVPHLVAGRGLLGGPSNAGALFVDWARELSGMSARHARELEQQERPENPAQVPVWLPYLRGERTPFNDRSLRAMLVDADITHGPEAIRRAAYEASGFVIRRMVEMSGVPATRVVASGGGSRSSAWMRGVADATGLPVESVAVSEGAAYGAAYLARMAAGLETSLDDAQRWTATGERYEPDPGWESAIQGRYDRFHSLGTGV